MKHFAYYQPDGTGRWCSSINSGAKAPEFDGLLLLEVPEVISGPFYVSNNKVHLGTNPIINVKLTLQDVQNKRNRLLQESDWVVIKALESGTLVPDSWQQYRQALRDITLFDLDAIIWPEKPT